MTRARLGALAVGGLFAAVVMIGFPAHRSVAQEAPTRTEVFLFLVPGLSFEDAMVDPQIASLASHGGAALMSLGGGLPTASEARVAPGPQNVHVQWLDPATEGGSRASRRGSGGR